jgi:DNA modification methylase
MKLIKGSETGTSFRQALGLKEAGFNLHDTMIWRKTNPMPKVKTKRYFDVFEFMFVFSKVNLKLLIHLCNLIKWVVRFMIQQLKKLQRVKKELKKTFILNTERYKDNIWECAIAQNKTDHPAVFPEKLVSDHILSWSNEGDIVYDPFMGSGTTAIVAKKLNRNYIGSEISTEYCILAKSRL